MKKLCKTNVGYKIFISTFTNINKASLLVTILPYPAVNSRNVEFPPALFNRVLAGFPPLLKNLHWTSAQPAGGQFTFLIIPPRWPEG